MLISKFYEKTLGANLSNSRWSWGAFNPGTNQLFLRVWDDGIKVDGDDELIHILNRNGKSKSLGLPERKRHVEQLKNGVEGYGVLCVADNKGTKARLIKEFDQEVLLKFGEVVEKRNNVYVKIVGRIPVKDLARRQTGNSTLSSDLKKIINKKGEGDTAKESLIYARIGQGMFRMQVLYNWGNRCCVTGAKTLEAIRASHIKPWQNSDNSERLDPNNGLPLIATLDALFDAGLITFDEKGKLLTSIKVKKEERKTLGLADLSLTKRPNVKTKSYLTYHRKNIFVDD